MKSGRQRREEIQQKRAKMRDKAEVRAREQLRRSVAVVNTVLLRPTNSYGVPDFVERGYYLDRPFCCRDCGKPQVWTSAQQKWWYESAKGDVWTVAVRCRPCRRRERDRVATARKVHAEGLAMKRHKT